MTPVHRNIDFKERCYRLAFSMMRGVNPETGSAILQRMHSECDFFRATPAELQTVMGMKSPLFEREYRDRLLAIAESEAVYNDVNRIRELYFTDNDYPQLLRECSDAPLMLYEVPLKKMRAFSAAERLERYAYLGKGKLTAKFAAGEKLL